MNQQSEHLSDAQIEEYGSQSSAAGPETEAWVEKHLDDCPLCRGRVLNFQRTRFALLPDPKVKTVPTSACPSEDDLRDLAAGLCSEPITQKLQAHVATCGHCGPLLREYTEDFSDSFTPEEQAVLDQFKSASPKWQRQTAREMLHATRPPAPLPSPRPWIFSWKWLMVPALPAVAFIAVGIWYLQRDTPEQKAEKLLAQAYTEDRTIEMRWPGAKWGELAETLGPGHGKKSLSLLQAGAVIPRQTPETPKNREWLHVQAQKEILSGTDIPALQQLIDDLNKATQSHPAPPPLMFDLAMANFRMGEMTQDPLRRADYYRQSKAILDKLLATSRSSAALFDRAVVDQRLFESAVGDERLQLRNNAIADLEECLNSEKKDSSWRPEIQQKIQNWNSFPDR